VGPGTEQTDISSKNMEEYILYYDYNIFTAQFCKIMEDSRGRSE